MDANERRNIILDNYKNPYNKEFIKDDSYIYSNTNNESCIDEVNLMVKILDGVIVDVKFYGEACAMCTSSSSLMIKQIIGKNLKTVKNIYDNFYLMLDGKDYDSKILGDLIVFNDISKQPNRRTCVTLSWEALKKVLDKCIKD